MFSTRFVLRVNDNTYNFQKYKIQNNNLARMHNNKLNTIIFILQS